MSVFCGQCPLEFETDELYLEHVCEKSGVVPTDPQFMGKHWDTISTKALERGEKDSTKAKTDKAIADVKALKESTTK